MRVWWPPHPLVASAGKWPIGSERSWLPAALPSWLDGKAGPALLRPKEDEKEQKRLEAGGSAPTRCTSGPGRLGRLPTLVAFTLQQCTWLLQQGVPEGKRDKGSPPAPPTSPGTWASLCRTPPELATHRTRCYSTTCSTQRLALNTGNNSPLLQSSNWHSET